MSLEQAGSYTENGKPVPESVREINDINDILTPYLGTWNSSYGDKSIEIFIYRDRFEGEYSNINEDRINFTYKIFDLNNNVLISSESPGLRYAFGLYYRPSTSDYILYLRDACRDNKSVILRPYTELTYGGVGNVEKMKFIVMPPIMGGTYSSLDNFSNCSSVADLLPSNEVLTLTKQ